MCRRRRQWPRWRWISSRKNPYANSLYVCENFHSKVNGNLLSAKYVHTTVTNGTFAKSFSRLFRFGVSIFFFCAFVCLEMQTETCVNACIVGFSLFVALLHQFMRRRCKCGVAVCVCVCATEYTHIWRQINEKINFCMATRITFIAIDVDEKKRNEKKINKVYAIRSRARHIARVPFGCSFPRPDRYSRLIYL